MTMESSPAKKLRISLPVTSMTPKESIESLLSLEGKLTSMIWLMSLLQESVSFYFILVTQGLKGCVGNVDQLTDASYIAGLKKNDLEKQLLASFDFDNNNEVKWSEFYIGKEVKKSHKDTDRSVFQFFDKNHDWKISHRELLKAKVSGLNDYLGGAQKRRRTKAGNAAKKAKK